MSRTPRDVPRLTTALRAFANLSISYETPSPAEYEQLLAKKKRLRAEKLANSEILQWSHLSQTLKNSAVGVKQDEVVTSLRELLQISKAVGKCCKL